jgi:simple sugar transport system substrate-binding protein
MKTKVLALFIILTFVLSACQAAATPETPVAQPTATQQPAQDTPAAPAEDPTATPEAAEVEPTATAEETEPEEFVFGMLLVGPYNDHGWSQAHYEAGEYVMENEPGTRMVYIDRVNPADRAGTTGEQLAESLVNQGAQFIIFNSDDMKEDALNFARNNPGIPVIHASGDFAWQEGYDYQGQENLGNIMFKMEYGKMIGGCAAALTTQTGQIGYLGPLINDETRRLAASAYLGARYCWEEYLGNDPADLQFRVTWIGFWFNIPGFTSDPTQVANDFFNSGFDVVISGIDTTEALTEASRQAGAGSQVWAVPYDFEGACNPAPEVCLGVPYYNWGPDYLEEIRQARQGTWQPTFQWNDPDWSDLNNHDTSPIGFVKGPALSADASSTVDQFISELAGGLELWSGPLNFQDGSTFLAEGETATDQQIWYLPQLLEGMEGQSVAD